MEDAKNLIFGRKKAEKSDMSEEEPEISYTPPDYIKNKTTAEGKGLKIMTLKQMITRLPILLAQKQAGNNSNKLKNEIRQIIYFLYRSKYLPKILYNHPINSI